MPAGPASAQSIPDGGPDPSEVRVRIGPLWVNPRVELSNIGVDTNVFNQPDDQNPKTDFTLTLTPSTDVWLRLGRSWLKVNIREDIVYFRKFPSERSVNNHYTVGWRLPLNRLIVDVSPDYLNTRERPGFDIDARSRRREYGGRGQVEVRMFSKTFIGLNGSWRRVDFDQDAFFLGNSLRRELNRTVRSGGASLRHQLTPLTAISLNVSREHDRFAFSPLRDSNSTAVSGSVSFDPHALIKGSASFGYRDFRPLSSGLPGFKGSTGTGELSYTLLGTTRFGVQFKRDVVYSFDVNEPYFLETGFNGSVAQQVFGPFDAIVRAGRSRLAFTDRQGAVVPVSNRVDRVKTIGGGIGYHLGRELRIGFNVDKQRRTSGITRRRFDGLRYGVAVTYGF